jgi:hypothetical protein
MGNHHHLAHQFLESRQELAGFLDREKSLFHLPELYRKTPMKKIHILVARFLNSIAIADEAFAPKSRSEEESMC